MESLHCFHCNTLCFALHFTQLGRLDFAACKIWWKHIAWCLNLALHFASSKTLILNKGFACTNVHWNLYHCFHCDTICFALHFTICRTCPTFEVWPHAKLLILFWILQSAFTIMLHMEYDKWISHSQGGQILLLAKSSENALLNV